MIALAVVAALALSVVGLLVYQGWSRAQETRRLQARADALAGLEEEREAIEQKTAGEIARIAQEAHDRKVLTKENLQDLHERTRKPWPPR